VNIKKMAIIELNPAKYNPRKNLQPGDAEFEKLKRSIKTFGYVEPIVINIKNKNTVISGHQRLNVLKHLGQTEVECVLVELDDVNEKALNLVMNKVSGSWEKEALADLIKGLQDISYDVALTGFDAPEIDTLFSEVYSKDVKEDEFDLDEALKEPVISKPGDLWLLGRHRLLCADATNTEDVEKLMDGKKANLVVTDPPYGVNFSGSQGKIKNDNLQGEEFYNFLLNAFVNMDKSMTDDASIYVFHADTKGIFFRRAFEDAGFHLSGVCQWVKQSFVIGRSPYQWKHEPCLFGFKKKGKHKWYAGRKESTVWNFDRPSRSELHSTQKPISLIAYPIKNSTAENAIVLDLFGGSGSTLCACEQLNRICNIMEIEERFIDVITKRYIQEVESDKDVFLIRNGEKIPYNSISTK